MRSRPVALRSSSAARALSILAIWGCGGSTSGSLDGGASDAGSESGGPAAWPQFQRTPEHTGGTATAVATPVSVKWTFAAAAAGQTMDTPVVGAGDVTYVIANSPSSGMPPATLYAVSPNGSAAWSQPVGAAPANAAVIVVGADGTIFAQTSQAGVVYAFDPSGTLKWQATTVGDSEGLSACADGSLYAGYIDGTVLSINTASGAIRWQLAAASGVASYLACSADGSMIYVPATTDKALIAVSSNGTVAWTAALPD